MDGKRGFSSRLANGLGAAGYPLLMFFAARLFLLMATPIDGLLGYGDYRHFFQLAALPGWPFLDYWVEFPPVFPFLSKIIFLLSGGSEHVYDYLLIGVISFLDAGSIFLFSRLSSRLTNAKDHVLRLWIFTAILAMLPYGWWYFDPLVVFSLLLGIWFWTADQAIPTGIAITVGTLAKFIPAVALGAIWKKGSGKHKAWVTGLVLGINLLVFVGLGLGSPEMTKSSLISQGKKGSWETVWALIDGNYQTGNFGPVSERTDPATAQSPQGHAPRVHPLWTLPVFLALGLCIYRTTRVDTVEAWLAFLGITLVVVFLWMPGWSPQWVLYLIPLVLLGLPLSQGVLMALVLTLVNLLEWPVLLSRGFFWGLWLTIPMRTILLVFLGVVWYQAIRIMAPRAAPATLPDQG